MSLAGPGAGEKRTAAWAVTRPTGGAGLPGPIFASGGLLGGFPSAAFATPSSGLPARIEELLSFVRQFSCSQSLLACCKGLVLVQDTFWILVWLRRHSEGVKFMSFLSLVAIPLLKK
jgi:hypothetical protein